MLSRTLTALSLCVMLNACASLSGRINPKPENCPVELTGAVPAVPQVPDGAGFPGPSTEVEREATALYMAWLATFGKHDKDLYNRLIVGQKWCEDRLSK